MAAFARREYLVARSYRTAFVLDAFHGLLELAAYYFISQSLHGADLSDLQGAPSYFAFAAVGIGVATVVSAATDGIGHRLREEQLTGTLEALVAQPLRSAELCAGLAAFPFMFALARAVVYLSIAAVWMDLDVSQTSWDGLIIILLCAGAAFSALGVLAAALVLVFKRGPVLASVVMFAMTLLGGAVFPISALPDWLEPVADVLPTRFAYDGARSALFEGGSWADDALALVAFAVIALPAAVWLFARALDLTRRRGSLAQY